ncbi:hypothetical protein Q4I28_000318 [Leishmania naiffi]|uniref:Uncharacterized protein n=1 Tax=Leishmania naiffi TaxID=5678 RepID=A0AAW3C9F4_9TRYP
MHQRVDAHNADVSGGGAFDTYENLRKANAEKLQTLLSRTAHRTAAAGGGARSLRKSGSLTGDYLDFENAEFGGQWMNLGWGLMIAVALLLFYVLWFTDWVR